MYVSVIQLIGENFDHLPSPLNFAWSTLKWPVDQAIIMLNNNRHKKKFQDNVYWLNSDKLRAKAQKKISESDCRIKLKIQSAPKKMIQFQRALNSD